MLQAYKKLEPQKSVFHALYQSVKPQVLKTEVKLPDKHTEAKK